MPQFVLWLNMIAFALMIAAVGFLALVHNRMPRPWLADLALYTASYAAWLLFGTYAYVQAVFLTEPLPGLELTFAYVRVGVSFFVLVFGSRFYLGLATEKKQATIVLVGAVAVVAGLVVLFLGFAIAWAATAVTILFNAYFAGLSVAALARVAGARDARRRVAPFLVFSAVAYVALTMFGISLLFFTPARWLGIPLNVLVSGILTVTWGALLLVTAMRWLSATPSGTSTRLSDAFVTDFGISPREVEIVTAVQTGSTSKEIGAALFISQRTVETHLQSVYRKCGVTNRVELVNLLSRYTGTGT